MSIIQILINVPSEALIPYSLKLTFQVINTKIDFFALISGTLISGNVNFGDLNYMDYYIFIFCAIF